VELQLHLHIILKYIDFYATNIHAPSASPIIRLSTWKPAMRSRSLLPRAKEYETCVGPDTRRPRAGDIVDSRPENELADVAQREFFRMIEVTDEISEKSICLGETDVALNAPL
jgi:hypothetical protein